MIVDVIIPTCNRESLLARTLESLRSAALPPDLEARVLVVDNNSSDGTAALVRREEERFAGRLRYLFEPREGKPFALNAGIAATRGDLVGLIDDDEEVERDWFACVRRAFAREDVDFIGGRCLPRWGAPAPAWLGARYRGVIGWVDGGDVVRPLDRGYPGILTGGNAVIRRKVLERAGPYATALSRTGTRLLGCEDEDMYHRLLALGARGLYRPDLIIYHYVPPGRLTKRYFRRWCFWRGVALGLMDRTRPAPVAYLAGVPRYLFGRVLRGLPGLLRAGRQADAAARFESELACWDLAGFLYGRHLYRVRTGPTSLKPTPVARGFSLAHADGPKGPYHRCEEPEGSDHRASTSLRPPAVVRGFSLIRVSEPQGSYRRSEKPGGSLSHRQEPA